MLNLSEALLYVNQRGDKKKKKNLACFEYLDVTGSNRCKSDKQCGGIGVITITNKT